MGKMSLIRFHLGCCANDRSCTSGELHVIGGVGVLVDILPRRVPDACKGASRVHHGLRGYVFWVMQIDWDEPQALAFGCFDGGLCFEVMKVIDLREGGRACV